VWWDFFSFMFLMSIFPRWVLLFSLLTDSACVFTYSSLILQGEVTFWSISGRRKMTRLIQEEVGLFFFVVAGYMPPWHRYPADFQRVIVFFFLLYLTVPFRVSRNTEPQLLLGEKYGIFDTLGTTTICMHVLFCEKK